MHSWVGCKSPGVHLGSVCQPRITRTLEPAVLLVKACAEEFSQNGSKTFALLFLRVKIWKQPECYLLRNKYIIVY
jgi:hypothetical protein